MSNDQLLPCPFCGGAKTENHHDDGITWTRCKSCGATGPELSKYSGEEGESFTDWNTRAQLQPASVAVPANEVRKVVTDAMVSMVAGVTGLVPPSGPGAIPDFVQAPIDRAVTQITELLAASPAPEVQPTRDVAALVEALEQIYDEDYQVGHDATDSDASHGKKMCIFRIRRIVKDALAAHRVKQGGE